VLVTDIIEVNIRLDYRVMLSYFLTCDALVLGFHEAVWV